jgi:chromosome transmission fidelity protein 18
MEVDMDMPDPEELEWMESHGLLPEEEEYAYFDDPEEGSPPAAAAASKPRDPPEVAAPSPAKPQGTHRSPARRITNLALDCLDADSVDQIAHEDEVPEANLKRPPPPPPPEQEEERSKRRNVEREDPVDEDWLRYSPPPAVEVVAEKTVSRFASEIQGDCMPVTAPNGERVYAKLATEKLVSEVIEGTMRRASVWNPNPSHKG